MSENKRKRTKNRKANGRFISIPLVVLDHEAYMTLGLQAKALLTEFVRQYNGSNNGDLVATASHLKPRGWNSNDQIRKGLRELIDHGLVIQTRQGRRPKIASLYALTFRPIDKCGGKLEVEETQSAPNYWKKFRFLEHRHTVQSTPPHGAIGGEKVVPLNRHAVQ